MKWSFSVTLSLGGSLELELALSDNALVLKLIELVWGVWRRALGSDFSDTANETVSHWPTPQLDHKQLPMSANASLCQLCVFIFFKILVSVSYQVKDLVHLQYKASDTVYVSFCWGLIRKISILSVWKPCTLCTWTQNNIWDVSWWPQAQLRDCVETGSVSILYVVTHGLGRYSSWW